MQAIAKELSVVLIVPIFERQAAGIYRNSAVVIDADGAVLGTYRKMHIPDDPLYNESRGTGAANRAHIPKPYHSPASVAGNAPGAKRAGRRNWQELQLGKRESKPLPHRCDEIRHHDLA
jgi:hypothetical protein